MNNLRIILYLSYSSVLSETDKFLQITQFLSFENRLGVRKSLKKVAGKGKVVVVSTALGVLIFFFGMGTAPGMGLAPMPQTPIPKMRIYSACY